MSIDYNAISGAYKNSSQVIDVRCKNVENRQMKFKRFRKMSATSKSQRLFMVGESTHLDIEWTEC